MNIFFTADAHYNHFNIIKYTNRPFKTLDEMNKTMIDRFNQRVKPGDLVFFVGDFCFKSANDRGNGQKENPEHFINQLNTTNIVFVSGNHDCFSEDTLLLTIRGYKKYEELKIGDLIPTLNLISRKLEIQPIEDIIVNPVNEIYGFKNRSSEGKFSSNHKLLFAPYNHNRFDQTPLTKNTVKELEKDLETERRLTNAKENIRVAEDILKTKEPQRESVWHGIMQKKAGVPKGLGRTTMRNVFDMAATAGNKALESRPSIPSIPKPKMKPYSFAGDLPARTTPYWKIK